MQLRATTAAPARIVPEIPLSRLSLFLRTVVCFFLSVCFSFFHLLFIVYRRGFSYLLSPIPVETLPPLLSSPLLASPVSSRSTRSLFLTRIKKKGKKNRRRRRRRKEKKNIFSRVVSSRDFDWKGERIRMKL